MIVVVLGKILLVKGLVINYREGATKSENCGPKPFAPPPPQDWVKLFMPPPF